MVAATYLFHSALPVVGALHSLLFHLALEALTFLVSVVAVLAGVHLLLCVDFIVVVAAARVALESHFASNDLTDLLSIFCMSLRTKVFFQIYFIK